MVALVDLLAPAPQRAGGITQTAYVLATDAWHVSVVAFVPQFNASITEFNADKVLIAQWKADAEDAADRAEAASGFRVSLAAALWTDLAAIAGSYDGQTAAVPASDGGSHTDPVVGGTVDNAGRYAWSEAEEAWRWLDDGTSGSTAWADVTGKPESFPPSPHSHAISGVTGLQDELDARVLTSALAELVRDTIAAALVQGAGVTITPNDGADTITIAAPAGSIPAAGIVVSTGSEYTGSLAVPSGSLVGTTAAQTLFDKTLGTGTIISAGYASGLTLRAGCVVDDTGTIAANSPGFRGAPPVSGGSLTLGLTHAGKGLIRTGNVSIPANSTVAFPIGTMIPIYNNSGSAISVSITSDTLRLHGSSSTGTRTLAARGAGNLWKVGTTEWVAIGDFS